jgi:hypothetical protein
MHSGIDRLREGDAVEFNEAIGRQGKPQVARIKLLVGVEALAVPALRARDRRAG